MNPVVALGMKQNAVLRTRRTTFQARDPVVQAPSRDPGDLRNYIQGSDRAVHTREREGQGGPGTTPAFGPVPNENSVRARDARCTSACRNHWGNCLSA